MIVHCSQADSEHKASRRQYAHTFHKDNQICVASAYYDLPEEYRYGILLHEWGHLLNGDTSHTEGDANLVAYKAFGIPIEMIDSPYGENLEHIQPVFVDRVKELFMRKNKAKSGKQYRFMQAAAHGKTYAEKVPKSVAEEFIHKTPKKLRSKFSKKNRRNGMFDETAEELAVGFHGRPVREEIDVTEKEEYKKDQAVIGLLEELEILDEEDPTYFHTITFKHNDDRSRFGRGTPSDTVFVTFPDRNQIEFIGGDQRLPQFDNEGKRYCKIGYIWSITYWADKYHLSDGTGFSSYIHHFAEDSVRGNNEKPSLKVVEDRIPYLPCLVYDVQNAKCMLVGGSYTISDEGIAN